MPITRLITKNLLISLPALCIAVAPLTSHAADAGVTLSRQVSAAGIDLNTREGGQLMYERLKQAARALCSTSDPVYKAPSWVYRACMEEALAKTMHNIHRPFITQAFVEDYGSEAVAKLGAGTRLANK